MLSIFEYVKLSRSSFFICLNNLLLKFDRVLNRMIFFRQETFICRNESNFIIFDNRALFFPKNNNLLISNLCNRYFGIGADGLILLENDENSNFKMIYYNADGNESTMCGNGGRCIVAFAKKLQLFDKKTKFSFY